MDREKFAEEIRKYARNKAGEASYEFYLDNSMFKLRANWDNLHERARELWSELDDVYTEAFTVAFSEFMRENAPMPLNGPESEYKSLYVLDDSGQPVRV